MPFYDLLIQSEMSYEPSWPGGLANWPINRFSYTRHGNEAGYSEDDAVREDLLIVAVQIVGDLNVVDGNSNPDHTFMRNLAKMAEELAANLDVIATDLEPEA